MEEGTEPARAYSPFHGPMSTRPPPAFTVGVTPGGTATAVPGVPGAKRLTTLLPTVAGCGSRGGVAPIGPLRCARRAGRNDVPVSTVSSSSTGNNTAFLVSFLASFLVVLRGRWGSGWGGKGFSLFPRLSRENSADLEAGSGRRHARAGLCVPSGPSGPFDGSGTLYQGFHGDDPAVCADWVCPGHDVATTEKGHTARSRADRLARAQEKLTLMLNQL